MLNYDVLSDFDFELLSKDVLSKMLGIDLFHFPKGPDHGIDLANEKVNPTIIVQVKHYSKSSFSQLKAALKKELKNLEKLKPITYYIVTSQSLSLKKIEEIYLDFKEYMPSPDCILRKEDLDSFLMDKSNGDILRKHFKLWLTADLVLSEMLNQDVFIDCEYLLEDIEEEMSYFVETDVFFQSLNILQEHKKILLYGDPGVGKTITSKMLLLNFIKQGYSVRYTTNGSIANLKQSLSADKDKKEIVFLDDFLGQHYMNLQANQENEVLSLVRYIDRNPSKMLILNSRITILNQAVQNFSNLDKYLTLNDFRMYKIDLGLISDVEKARIFLAKLKQFKVPNDYYNDVRKNYRYRTIINHKNYNPRLIEFVCTPKRYNLISTDNYYDFILNNLQSPKAVWKNEFNDRLEYLDRILMYVLYSISDNKVDVDKLKIAFDYFIKDSIEESIDHFDSIIGRLNESLLKMDVHLGKHRVGVINPSVNDYLSAAITSNLNLRNKLLDRAVYYNQLERLMDKDEFEEKLKRIIWEEEDYYSLISNHNYDLIIHLIAKYRVESDANYHLVFQLLFDGLNDVNIGKVFFTAFRTLIVFLEDDLLWKHYDLKNYPFNEDTIDRLFSECSDIEDAVTITNLLTKRLNECDKDYSELQPIIKKELDYRMKYYIEEYDYGDLIAGRDFEEVSEIEMDLYNEFKHRITCELMKLEDEGIKINFNFDHMLTLNDFSLILNDVIKDLMAKRKLKDEPMREIDYTIDDILNRKI